MKKKIVALLLAVIMVLSIVACSKDGDDTPGGGENVPDPDTSELDGVKFKETRHITVEVYDRGNDGGSDPTNNMYTDYIKNGMLETHNVEVEFVKVPRWTEVEEINNLLAAQTAPDICLTYSYPTVLSYAEMGGVMDLSKLIEQYKDMLPNLWGWLGETNMYWDKDPVDGTIWALEGKRADVKRICTFVRQDWLDALGLDAPTTTQEFEDMLRAFKDRANELPVDDPSKVVPFSTSYDVGWRCAPIIESFMDPNITDYDYYINGFDDRKVQYPSTEEAMRLLNEWYNDGLMWNNFALYGSGDTTEDDNMKAGYVGAFCHNWDYPFRNASDSINANLVRNVGEGAKFVAIDPFEASDGSHPKYLYSSAGDRKVFFPVTNDEPLACLFYLDWISNAEHIQYLQLGDEGVTHEVLEGGAYKSIAATGAAIMNSGNNIDYTITCNGLNFADPEITRLSQAHGYAEVDPEDVAKAIEIAMIDGISPKNVNVGTIEAEAGVGDTLSSKRDQVFDQAIVAAADKFDAVWDEWIADYLSSGAQAIHDERVEKWQQYFGDATMLP